MKDYSYREGDKVLQKLINSKNKDKRYISSRHIKKQALLRKINIKYVEKMLLTKEPLGLLSSRKNRFKVYFPSELNPKNDLIVLIAFDSDDKIIGVTTYEDPITKREGVK